MARGPEQRLTPRAIDALKQRGAQVTKIHGEGRQSVAVDLLCCYRGRYVAIELKGSEKDDPTPPQARFLRQTLRAGGIAEICWTVEQCLAVLNRVDRQIEQEHL